MFRGAMVVAAVLCLLGAAQAQEAAGPAGPGRLTVVGEGRAQAVPDMATIRVGVTAEAATAAEALEETSIAAGELLTLLSEMGIAPEDVQTTALSLQPLWRDRASGGLGGGGTRAIVGYRADNGVRLRVRAMPDLGAMLDDIVANGANRFDGLSFGLQDPAPVQDAARRAAVADARRKAALYAEAAGVALGRVLSITEPGAADRVAGPEMAMALSRADVPVAAGALEMRAKVTVVYEITSP